MQSGLHLHEVLQGKRAECLTDFAVIARSRCQNDVERAQRGVQPKHFDSTTVICVVVRGRHDQKSEPKPCGNCAAYRFQRSLGIGDFWGKRCLGQQFLEVSPAALTIEHDIGKSGQI